MAPLKPWRQVATPREDLRSGEPLDASEFAIHLDHVTDGRAPRDYQEPDRFFARTYLTAAYRKLAVEVMRRLAGETTGTSPGVNLTTQFGGGKTHFLTLLYHLFRTGDAAREFTGVPALLREAGLETVPQARVATFVGNYFDLADGVGADGEPRRRTPWGDIAWQLGGQAAYSLLETHDRDGVVPGGAVLRKLFEGQPTLILMDEVLSFTRRARDAGGQYANLGSQLYSFLDVLTREVTGWPNLALVVSLPLSEYEMTQEDQADFQRLDKLLGRLSKAVLLSEQMEIAEIVRRRLFESLDVDDRKEIAKTARAYGEWVCAHREQLPGWFPCEQAQEVFAATYPFHPALLSVFERKWQALPSFGRTRGILRLLALWVSHAWQDANREARKDPLVSLGTAPLDDSLFRAAAFDQLGEDGLEAAVMADIAGPEAHAVRLDAAAPDSLKRMRLHQKVCTSVFFESSGGQKSNAATLPETRLAVGEPDFDIGNVETVLEDLVRQCYFLDAKGTGYWISQVPTLNKVLADRRAGLAGPEGDEAVREQVRSVIREVFDKKPQALDTRPFIEESGGLPNVPALVLVVLAPHHSWESSTRETTRRLVTTLVQECGSSGRTYKSGLLFAVADTDAALVDEARTLLAVRSLSDPAEQERLGLAEAQVTELGTKERRSLTQLRENVWTAYRTVLLLDADNALQEVDLGQLHSSSGVSITSVMAARLKQEDLLQDERVSPDFLVRNWPAFNEWTTKSVREMFYASPKFPRLTDPDILRHTIADGVRAGKFGYVGKAADGQYQGEPTIDNPSFGPGDVEFSEQVVLLREVVRREPPGPEPEGGTPSPQPGPTPPPVDAVPPPTPPATIPSLTWEGEVPPQKWMNFYTKVLARFATDPSLRLRVQFTVAPPDGVSPEKAEETKMALRELGLIDDVGPRGAHNGQ